MFETLKSLLTHYGSESKAVVWAHNSHVGDAAATEMSARGEHNIGQLCRQEFGDRAYLVGFGTHSGTVAAASNWDGPMEIKDVRPSLAESYEAVFHATGIPRFMLNLRDGPAGDARQALMPRRGWRGRSGSSTAPRPSLRATISRPCRRDSSTAISGSMEAAR